MADSGEEDRCRSATEESIAQACERERVASASAESGTAEKQSAEDLSTRPSPEEWVAEILNRTPEERAAACELAIKKEFLEPPVCPWAEGVSEEGGSPPTKRPRRGRNAENRPQLASNEKRLCSKIASGLECPFGEKCRFMHSIDDYLASKPADLDGPCVQFRLMGECGAGFKCRFLKDHYDSEKKQLIVNEEVKAEYTANPSSSTWSVDRDVPFALGRHRFKFPLSAKLCTWLGQSKAAREGGNKVLDTVETPLGEVTLPVEARSKKPVDFSDKSYLAPLTTVGNLPFRRLCKGFGVDITCGEMAMATQLLNGKSSEWALLKRHSSEDLFGVQLAGGYPNSMSQIMEVFQNDNLNADFIDINCGCPLDAVYTKKAGCALIAHPTALRDILLTMNPLSSLPITVKIRMGIREQSPVLHEFLPYLGKWGAAVVTVHGRSRMQRYSKRADYDYLTQCSKLSPIPFIPNGDIYSWEEANQRKAETGCSTLMIGRAGLIKPWLFTEMKEQRYWDISASERLDMVKRFCDYGLEHWGSDSYGVEQVRYYFLNWHSFACRYVPIGMLERLPEQINWRPPTKFHGRNETETLLASRSVDDWVKISEMFLGPVKEDFSFTPKHRSEAY